MSYIPKRKDEIKILFSIATPLTAAWIAEMAMFITDMIMVGKIGSKELAAVGLAGDWFWVLLLIGMGIISMVGVLAAQSLGENNPRGATEACEQGMIAASITSIPVMLLVWYLGYFLQFANQDPEVVGLIDGYAKILTYSVFPALWWAVLRNYLTALNKAGVIGWITICALVLNVGLNYTLIYGKFGFPKLGVNGAGIGTTIVTWLMFFTLVFFVLTLKSLKENKPKIFAPKINWLILKEIFQLGLPNSLTQVLIGSMFTVAAIIVGMISAAALAAQQIIYSVIYAALCAPLGLGEAVRVRVAYGAGKKSIELSQQSANIASFLAGLSTLGIAFLLWFFPEKLIGIFLDINNSKNLEVINLSIKISLYAGFFLLIDGILIVIREAVRGFRDTRSPLWISITGYWIVGMSTGVVLCIPLNYGPTGLWAGLVSGVIFANILMFWKFSSLIRKMKQSHFT